MPRKKKESAVTETPKTEKVVKTKLPEFYQAVDEEKNRQPASDFIPPPKMKSPLTKKR